MQLTYDDRLYGSAQYKRDACYETNGQWMDQVEHAPIYIRSVSVMDESGYSELELNIGCGAP